MIGSRPSLDACPGQSFGGGVEDVSAIEAPGEAGEVALGMLSADVERGGFA